MSKEELEERISSTEKELKDLKKELYNLQNKELFDSMKSKVGKYFRKRVSTGCSEYLRIDDKNDTEFLVTRVIYTSFRIGWFDLSVTYSPLSYKELNSSYEEIDEETFYRCATQLIGFGTKDILEFKNGKKNIPSA